MSDAGGAKKRVLFMVDKSGFGGIQTIAYTLMNHEVSDDVELYYYFLRNINDRFGMKDIERDNVFYSSSSGRYGLVPFMELARLVRRHHIDILHANGNKSVIFAALLKKLVFPDLKVCAHEHGGVFDYTRWYALFVRLFSNSIDIFVSLSNYRKDFLVSRCRVAASKVRVLYNFVDPARIGAAARAPGGKSRRGSREDSPFVIGYLGGLSRIKGCDVLLHAIPILKRRMNNFRVIIAGDGPARAELEELAAKLDLTENVVFAGYVREPAAVYAEFDVMVIPSRSEAGPMCLYEAWTMGLPVIASNAPVLNEIIRDGVTGILFESQNPEDLAEKILTAYRDTGLVEKLRTESSRKVANHSIGNYLAQLRNLYSSL